MFARQLGRELIVLIVIKVAALSLLFFLFFWHTRAHVDDDTAARVLLERQADPANTRP